LKKTAFILVAVCMLTVLGVGSAWAQKIAYVNTDLVVKKSTQAATIMKSLEAEFKGRNKGLVDKRKHLKRLEDKLAKDRAIMSSDEVKNMEKDIRRRRREINNASAEFREDLNLRRSEELNKLLRKISEVVIKVGKQEKIDIVMSAGVAYASKSVNITDKVLKQLALEAKKKGKK